jgi:hypothetical protein
VRRPRLIARESATDRRRRGRYEVLLVAILLAFFVQGIARAGRWEQTVVTGLLGVTLVVAALSADARPQVVNVLSGIAALLFVVSLLGSIADRPDAISARIANMLLVLLAPPLVVVGVTRSLRTHREVTIEAVFGVICLYLLIGMLFAFGYGLIQQVSGSNFFVQGHATGSLLLYYSFVTLATVGYGDYTAVSNLGHTLSVSEALIGQIYLVTVVALIVSNLGRRRQQQ